MFLLLETATDRERTLLVANEASDQTPDVGRNLLRLYPFRSPRSAGPPGAGADVLAHNVPEMPALNVIGIEREIGEISAFLLVIPASFIDRTAVRERHEAELQADNCGSFATMRPCKTSST